VIESAVKRALSAALALLLAGCETYGSAPPPPQGPYGEPAPYPYPGDEPSTQPPGPYPGGPYQPPANYPGGPYQPPPPGAAYPDGPPRPPECPITASRDWSAWVNAMPGPGSRGPALVVRGKVVTPTGGYQVAFDRTMQIRRGQPPQAFVTLFVAPPDGTVASQAASTHEVRWEWPLNQPVGSVIVRCGENTLAEITNIQTAY
jgi:hypothetical protein